MSAVNLVGPVGEAGLSSTRLRLGGWGVGLTREVVTAKGLPSSGKAEAVSRTTTSFFKMLPTSSVVGV